jgi:hypothetical protein
MNDYYFAVIVGINEYPSIGNLTAAHADAEDFRAWANDANGGGVPAANTKFRLAEIPPGATAAEVQPTTIAIYEQFIETMDSARKVPASQWKNTRLYFYCAGHGIALGGRDSALLAANVTKTTYGYHVSIDSLLDFFSRVQLFQEVVVFADCCRLRPNRNVILSPPPWNDDDVLNGGVNKCMAIGALYGQAAFEETEPPPDERRGYFTRALLSGLSGPRGATDRNTQRVTGESLGAYINEHMRKATKDKFRSPLRAEVLNQGTQVVDFGAGSA